MIGGWLRSSAEPRVLVRHLQSLMLPSEPRVGRRYLRLADRRVFEWIWPVLSPLQRQQWLGPINRWWALNRRNELVLHAMTEAVPEEPHHDPELLTAAQWTRLHDCELAQQILRGWSSFADPLPADYVPQAEHALRSVRSLGVAEPADIVLMSAYQLQIHPGSASTPRCRAGAHGAKQRRALAGCAGRDARSGRVGSHPARIDDRQPAQSARLNSGRHTLEPNHGGRSGHQLLP